MPDMLEVKNQREKEQGLIWEEASYTILLNIHDLKQQINQTRLLHVTDITEEISSFGGTINSSLQQLYTGLSLGRPAGLIPSTSQAYILTVHLHHATQRNNLLLNNTCTLSLTPPYFSAG